MKRTCSCGAFLSQSNPGPDCGPCLRTKLDGEILTHRAKAAEAAVWVYSHPEMFADQSTFLAALTNVMDAQARSYGVEPPPDFCEVFEVSEGRGVIQSCGEVSLAPSRPSDASEVSA